MGTVKNAAPAVLTRAYSLFTVKKIDEENRIIEGIATTPSPDRMGDIVEPEGAVFSLPLPFLWQHEHDKPIGEIFEAVVSKAGIKIKARILKIEEAGKLKDRLDEAWQSVKHMLVRGLSIGFMPIESARIENSWCYHYLKWDWMELSAVTIAANAEASILSIKSASHRLLTASGQAQAPVIRIEETLPGATGSSSTISQGSNMKTLREQITAFEAKRAASIAAMNTIMEKAGEEGSSLDAEASKQYDELEAEVKAIDEHLVRLKRHEKLAAATATEVTTVTGTDPAAAAQARAPSGDAGRVIMVRSNLEKGIPFTRYVKALAMAKGNLSVALAIAENNEDWGKSTPQVAQVLKAAVAGGDTTSDGWASQLVYNQNLVAEFIEVLRPMTILGKIPNLTQVPFNVRMSGADQGTSAYWVGQGKPVPVSKMHTLEVTLAIAKAAGLVVLTEELVRSSQPSAELIVRNDLMKAIAQFLDVQFVDPGFAAVANVSPASITNGVEPIAATGTASANLRTDVQTLFAAWITANLDPSGGVFIMTPTRALAISLMLNALGQPVFPKMTMNGGEFFGLPVVVSQSAKVSGSPVAGEGEMIILLNAPEILMADDGQVTIDASREASIEMLDNPTNSAATGAPTTLVSMFQTNAVAIRAVRFINWKKRRNIAVQYIKDAAYIS